MRTSLLKIGVAALLFVSDLVVGTLTAAEIVGIINTMDADLLSIDQTAGDINAVNEAAYLLGTGALYVSKKPRSSPRRQQAYMTKLFRVSRRAS